MLIPFEITIQSEENGDTGTEYFVHVVVGDFNSRVADYSEVFTTYAEVATYLAQITKSLGH